MLIILLSKGIIDQHSRSSNIKHENVYCCLSASFLDLFDHVFEDQIMHGCQAVPVGTPKKTLSVEICCY